MFSCSYGDSNGIGCSDAENIKASRDAEEWYMNPRSLSMRPH